MTFLRSRLNALVNLVENTEYFTSKGAVNQEDAFAKIFHYFRICGKERKKIFVLGNGGSSGIAAHHVVDLVNVAKLSAWTLSDSNLITCMANDYGYQNVYAEPLKVLAGQGDLLIAISSSGQSKNILEACEVIKEKNGNIITLSGFDAENPLKKMGDLNIWTGISDYGLVETAHFFILHTLVDAWSHEKPLSSILAAKMKNNQKVKYGKRS